jgi:hypothetical protein
MLTSILGARLRWHEADGWVFDPVIVGSDIIEYTVKEGPHAGRHAIQHIYYQRVAPGPERARRLSWGVVRTPSGRAFQL